VEEALVLGSKKKKKASKGIEDLFAAMEDGSAGGSAGGPRLSAMMEDGSAGGSAGGPRLSAMMEDGETIISQGLWL
jgi:hypothetical protein